MIKESKNKKIQKRTLQEKYVLRPSVQFIYYFCIVYQYCIQIKRLKSIRVKRVSLVYALNYNTTRSIRQAQDRVASNN